MLLCLLSYPLSAAAALFLLIPLVMYVVDHAPFQSLVLPRPDHYVMLISRVYRAWLGVSNGKLSSKEM